MLVLTRKTNQSIVIGDDIEVTVVEVRGVQVRLGINAPKEIPIYRREIYEEIHHDAAKICAVPNGHIAANAPAFGQVDQQELTTVGAK